MDCLNGRPDDPAIAFRVFALLKVENQPQGRLRLIEESSHATA